MTIPTTTDRVTYVGTGTTDTLPYTFLIFAATDLQVTLTDSLGNETLLVNVTDYTVSGVGVQTGGNVTLTAGNLAIGYTLTIFRNPSIVQDLLLQQGAAFNPADLMNALDLLTMIGQALQTQISDIVATPPEITWRDGQNAIINGDGRVGQRGAFTLTPAGTFGYGKCDRWKGALTGSGLAGTLTQDAAAGFGSTGYAIHFSAVSGATAQLEQFIEAKDATLLVGGQFSGSFLVKHDCGEDCAVVVTIYSANGVDNFAGVTQVGTIPAFTVPTGVVTAIAIPVIISTAAMANGVKILIEVAPQSGAMVTKNIRLTDVLLHPGASVLTYTPDDIALSFQKCQRYYWKSYDIGTAPGAGGAQENGAFRTVALDSSALYNASVRFPARMRIAPTVTVYSSNGGASGKVYDITAAADKTAGAGLIGDTGCQVAGSASLSAADVVEFHIAATADF